MIFGHQKNLKIFSKMIEEEKFPHAVLFVGPEKIGKKKIAFEISKYLEGNHRQFKNFFEFSQKECGCDICDLIERKKFPDIIEVNREEEGEQISIKKIREVQNQVSLSSPYHFKINILDQAENLSEEAIGALLKTLEEPRGKTIFFLITSMAYRLPKTILSRTEIFRFYPLSKNEIKNFFEDVLKEKEISQDFIDFSFGKPGLAKELILDKNRILYYNSLLKEIKKIVKLPEYQRLKIAEFLEKNGEVEDFLFLSERWFRDLLLKKQNTSPSFFSFSSKEKETEKESQNFSEKKLKEIISLIEKTKNYLNFSNTNQLLALENLLLRIDADLR
ncbi:MAG TPA: DNA polymerase III subunit delta' C-terminal domain-containing protein [Candidatus Pacearchaeota archaeon]|nr:DNA polymerase III subunit delta' C-terminal domain-containing protein [Candidatus Pacearchaeota archaeon]HOK94200.1 DNA polymerase III subunit delta' C-terminal domain-containing protein [Candidatus Pacearchaeota archaeon]HPO75416.1 DNA polymerase III subunit delta' C-terminal domain-containing protein [Candidatus Pacearchaeota archaeon]